MDTGGVVGREQQAPPPAPFSALGPGASRGPRLPLPLSPVLPGEAGHAGASPGWLCLELTVRPAHLWASVTSTAEVGNNPYRV